MIPVSACGGKTRMSVPRQRIVLALDDEFRLRKCIMISHMVYVEMGADEHIDVIRTQAKIGKMLDHIFFLLRFRRPRRRRAIPRQSAINPEMLPIAGLEEIATQDHFQRSTCSS